MRNHSLLTCLLFTLVVAGCDVGTLVDPGDSTGTDEVAGKTTKMVPIKGKATFAADMTAVPPVLDCGFGEVFFRRFTAEGITSHLGSMTNVMESDECWVNLDDGTLGVKGTSIQTAANGDQLQGYWAAKLYGLNPDGGPNLWDFYAYDADHPVEWTGGTGRFEGAYGYASGGGTFDTTTLIGTYWLDGVLSSVGSLK